LVGDEHGKTYIKNRTGHTGKGKKLGGYGKWTLIYSPSFNCTAKQYVMAKSPSDDTMT